MNNNDALKITEVDNESNKKSTSKKNTYENQTIWQYLKTVINPFKKMKIYDDYKRGKIKFKEVNEDDKSDKSIKREIKNKQNNKLNEIIYSREKLTSEITKNKLPLKYKIIISIISILFLAGLGILLYFLLRPPSPTKNPKIYKQEDLISSLTYKKNQILKFQSLKNTIVSFDFGNLNDTNYTHDKSNNTQNLKEYFDYIIGINDANEEIDNDTKREIYSGFIFLENYMIENTTHKMLLQNSSLMDNLTIKNQNLRNLQEKQYFNFSQNEILPYCCIDNGTIPIIKFHFYRNGKIIKILKPKNLITLFYDRMTEILEKLIPKIAAEDFNKEYNNFSEALKDEYEKIKNHTIDEDLEEKEDSKDGDEFIDDSFNIDQSSYTIPFTHAINTDFFREGETDNNNKEYIAGEVQNQRRLSEKNKKSKKIMINFRKLPQNETSLIINDTNNITNNSFKEEEISEIIEQEFNNEIDFNINLFQNQEQQNDTNSTNNYTNLNYYSHSLVRNDYSEFKGSQQNTSINSIIDENEQSLKEVHCINKGKLVNDTKFEKDLEKEREESCSEQNFLDCNDLANDTDENIINTQINGMDYEITEDIFQVMNFIDTQKNIINKLDEIFNIYENESEIFENQTRMNFSMRFLKDITDYVLANRFEFTDIKIELGEKGEKNRNLDEYNGYYGMKNSEYSKNIFSLNLLGIKMKLQITNTMNIKEGKSVIKIYLQFAFIKISITLKTVRTNMHLAIRNYNEMGYTELYLINESNDKLEKRNGVFSNIIINLEKEFNSLNINKHDFSNIFKESFDLMYDEIRSFTTEIFLGFIETVNKSYYNYTNILEEISNNKHEIFQEIRTLTKNEYISFINDMLLLVEVFNNKTFVFLLEVGEEVSRIDNFQIDLLYDLKDIIQEAKKIFKDFNKNLFLAIEKGIKTFKYDFKDFVHNIMGDLFYLVDFLSVNLNKNEILKNGMDDYTREDIINKMRNMRNIINYIVSSLLDKIELDYIQEIDESNLNSIKVYSNDKLNKYIEDLENNSTKIIEDIKTKIKFMNLYELYGGNIDKIEEIITGMKSVFFSDFYEDIIEKIKKLQPEYLNKNSLLIENKRKLFSILNLIDESINNEINDINDNIFNIIKNFKRNKQYSFYLYLSKIKKCFLDDSMGILRQKFENLINDTINIALNNMLIYNYNLGIEWLQEIAKALTPLHKRNECLQASFYSKYSLFVEAYQLLLPDYYSEENIEVYRKYYFKIRNTILDSIRMKIININYYYFNNSVYSNSFYFISQIMSEIEYIINNLENYYAEDYFDSKLIPFIIKYTSEKLSPINEQLNKDFENLRKTCEAYTDCLRHSWDNGDYCWNNNRVLKKWHYYKVAHTNNYLYLDVSFDKAEEFIKNGSNIIIREFINSFSNDLDSLIKDTQSLFDNIYNFTEKKLKNNQSLNELIGNYKNILDNMTQISNKEIIFEGKSIYYFLENIDIKSKLIENEFFENYYLENFTSYLEYPEEVLYKISSLENELKSSSETVKNQINNVIAKKLFRINEENQYFIYQTKDIFGKLLKIRMGNKNIFEFYKEFRLENNLNEIMNEYIYNNKSFDIYLGENIYDSKICNIIQEYKNIVYKIENQINNDWILNNCSDTDSVFLDNTNDFELIESDSSIISNIICADYKNKSSLNYSEYNFNVVKIRTAIYYLKYLYENLESLFEQFNFENLMNLTKIKQEDQILNDKDIINLYLKSVEQTSILNKEAEELLDEYLIFYEEDINETLKNESDFINNFESFKKILDFTDNNFISEINLFFNNNINDIYLILDKFNETLKEQILITNKYEKFNYNFSFFKEITENYLTEIELSFVNVENRIKNINEDYLFNNILKERLEELNERKTLYMKNLVKNISNKYEIKPFNLSFDISEKTEKILNRIMNNIMFHYIYDYIELYESNREIYINSSIEFIKKQKEKIIKKFNEIIKNFFSELNNTNTKYLDKLYLENYRNNYSRCLNYSIDELNETIIKDEENYNKYFENVKKIELCRKLKEKENIIDNTDIMISDMIESSNFTDFLDFSYYLCEELENNSIDFINETEILLDCDKNNYYSNYANFTYFDNFEENLLTNLSEISSKLINRISNSFYIGGEFIKNYVISNDIIKLENFEILSEKQIEINILNFKDMAEYINYQFENRYYIILKEEIIQAFNKSFKQFMESVISDDIINNLNIYILGKIDSYADGIKNKIKSEIEYYSLLINKTKELGVTSKKALITLFDYLYNRINKTLRYQIEDYIIDNIIFFYRDNQYLFKELFIDYYIQNSNNKIFGTENIFKLESYFQELLYDRTFNKTLEEISKKLWTENLIKNINVQINDKFDTTIYDLNNILTEQKNKIIIELQKIETAELYENMLILSNMINHYTDLVNEQNNRFKFTISNLPFEKFGYFSNNYLEPPFY